MVLNNDAAVEDAEDEGSESSGEMKVRDQRYLDPSPVGLVFRGVTGELYKFLGKIGGTLGKTRGISNPPEESYDSPLDSSDR